MVIHHHKGTIDELTPIMKDVLILLHKDAKTDSELLATIPNFSLDILGKLRDLDAIDHNGHLVYITSHGEYLLANIESNT